MTTIEQGVANARNAIDWLQATEEIEYADAITRVLAELAALRERLAEAERDNR